MKSIGQQITELSALIGTGDLTRWEDEFLRNAVTFIQPGAQTSAMSPKQVDTVGRLHRKYCERAEA